MYLQIFIFIFYHFLFFPRFAVFFEFLGVLINFPLVYTNILEQKRIARQA